MSQQGTIRLADRILNESRYTSPLTNVETWCNELYSELEQGVPVIAIDNVREYQLSLDKRDFQITDFPNAAPPFSKFFMECLNNRGGGHTGWYFESYRVDEIAFNNVNHMKAAITLIEKLKKSGSEPAHWIVRASIVQYPQKHYWAVPGGFYYACDERGAVLEGIQIAVCPEYDKIFQRHGQNVSTFIQHDAIIPLMALGFMHCKNVRQVLNEPPTKLSKAFRRRHGKPMLRYHTLEIEPMKNVLENEGKVGHNGLKKALHICRGHFATYSPERPLFGRVTGTVWKPSHVRGSASEGVVVKDYRVKAPATA